MKTAAFALVAVVMALMIVVPVGAVNMVSSSTSSSHYRDYEMKYAPAPTTALPTLGDIRGTIRAHQNDISTEVIAYGPSGTIIAPILADGTFEFTGLIPGVYQLYIADGNGGQPEYSTATVAAGKVAFPEKDFLGHAISVGDGKIKIVILEAVYGKIETRERTVVDQQAWDEQVLVKPAVPEHYEYVGRNHGDYNKWGCVYYYVGHNHGDYDKHPAEPAVYKTVHHPAVAHVETYEVGSIVDVTEEVQAAVDAGYTSIYFDNAKNPGGIFSAANDALIEQIADPAPGIVKDVKIKLGSGTVIDTNEYEVINL
jgi:hypothetical protein